MPMSVFDWEIYTENKYRIFLIPKAKDKYGYEMEIFKILRLPTW